MSSSISCCRRNSFSRLALTAPPGPAISDPATVKSHLVTPVDTLFSVLKPASQARPRATTWESEKLNVHVFLMGAGLAEEEWGRQCCLLYIPFVAKLQSIKNMYINGAYCYAHAHFLFGDRPWSHIINIQARMV